MVPSKAASCSCLVYYQRLRAFPVSFKAALHLQHPTAPCGSCTNQTCMCLCVISECNPECKNTYKGLSLVALLLSGMSIPTKSEVSLTEYLIYTLIREKFQFRIQIHASRIWTSWANGLWPKVLDLQLNCVLKMIYFRNNISLLPNF